MQEKSPLCRIYFVKRREQLGKLSFFTYDPREVF
jgi:hypothetical protein